MTCTLEVSQYSHNILSYNYLEEIPKKKNVPIMYLGIRKQELLLKFAVD